MKSDTGNINEETIILSKKDYQELINLRSENLFLKHELDKLKRMIFGSKSERFIPADPGQLTLDMELELQQPPEAEKETISYTRTKPKEEKKPGHARMPLPAHLPREEHIIEPEEDVSNCKKIGENITEILEYKPGKLYVKKYIRPKYARPDEQGIITGELPTLPIPRGNAGPGLLTQLIISKYVDHLPFYRQVKQFKRQDVIMAESTINDWFRATCNLLDPLYGKLKEKLLKTDYLMADETPIRVLTSQKKNASHKGYHWVYYSPVEKIVCFDYQKGRSREGPMEVLKDFKGTLQTDGYKAYDIFGRKQGIKLLACMAHARRKFDEAKDNDLRRATIALEYIQKLYKTERKAREEKLSYQARKQLRNTESIPVLQELEFWLKEELVKVLPKSAIAQAIAYTLNLWKRLEAYTEDGRYEIDNNLVENSIRPVAIGRKNYLFAGSHEGAKRAAMIYSFLETCKQNDVEPFAWLKDVIARIPDHKANRLMELLPQNWKPLPENQQ